jgi:hypothetical protein
LSALFWLSSYIASHHLAVVSQSRANNQFYGTIQYITLNPICVPQGAFKELKKLRKIGLEVKIY